MNFAIIGTNFISDRFCEAASRVPEASVIAVYSRNRSTADAFADKYGIEKRYTDYGEMLRDGDIDAVYIASPTFLHKEHSILAMRAGKAVLCEKMIVAGEDEFYELKREKERTHAVIIEAMRCDFDPVLSKVKELLPTIGKIKSACLEYRQYSSRYDRFLNGEILNAFDPSMKNSALADIGIYPLHYCVSLFGEPLEISSASEFLHNGFEGSGNILMKYDGFSSEIIYSKTVEGENISKIDGELGSIIFDKINEPKFMSVTYKNSKEGESFKFTAPEDSLNMANEIAEFIRIAKSDKESGDRLFSLTESVMRCVGTVYKQNNIFS